MKRSVQTDKMLLARQITEQPTYLPDSGMRRAVMGRLVKLPYDILIQLRLLIEQRDLGMKQQGKLSSEI